MRDTQRPNVTRRTPPEVEQNQTDDSSSPPPTSFSPASCVRVSSSIYSANTERFYHRELSRREAKPHKLGTFRYTTPPYVTIWTLINLIDDAKSRRASRVDHAAARPDKTDRREFLRGADRNPRASSAGQQDPPNLADSDANSHDQSRRHADAPIRNRSAAPTTYISRCLPKPRGSATLCGAQDCAVR
jgi:hypothetical protein